jgi:hypothetical protein
MALDVQGTWLALPIKLALCNGPPRQPFRGEADFERLAQGAGHRRPHFPRSPAPWIFLGEASRQWLERASPVSLGAVESQA